MVRSPLEKWGGMRCGGTLRQDVVERERTFFCIAIAQAGSTEFGPYTKKDSMYVMYII
jgi:hypothetical protein